MTEPGSIEKVPIKVVPMYIETDIVEEAEPETIEVEPESEPGPRRKTALVGALALVAALAVVVLDATAIGLATGGDYVTATVIAWTAIVLSILTIIAGLVAVVLHRGRRLGVAAAVLGLVANPFLMLTVLELVGGART